MRRIFCGVGVALMAVLLRGTTAAQGGVADNPATQTGRGPLLVRNQRTYNLLFLQFLPESGDILSRNKNRFDFQLDIANNLLIPRADGGATVIEDNETQRLSLTWHRGLGRQFEVAVSSGLLWRNGGVLDGILRAYHRLVGLPGNAEDNPAGRDSRPQYQSVVAIIDPAGSTVLNQGNAFGLSETTVTIKRALLPATRRGALSARLGLKIPTGNANRLLGSGQFDGGLSLDGRYSLGREVIAYLNVGGAILGRAGRVPGARPNLGAGILALEFRPNNRDSFVLQIDASSQVVRTGNRFADGANVTASFGYKRVLDRHLVLSASFSENGDIHNYNLPAFSNIGPDFTISTGLEWHP